jgi:hypothetical protein
MFVEPSLPNPIVTVERLAGCGKTQVLYQGIALAMPQVRGKNPHCYPDPEPSRRGRTYGFELAMHGYFASLKMTTETYVAHLRDTTLGLFRSCLGAAGNDEPQMLTTQYTPRSRVFCRARTIVSAR